MPASAVHTYFFGRLHLMGKVQSKRDAILKALEKHTEESDRNYRYTLLDGQELKTDDGLFVYARLAKFKTELEMEQVDVEEGHLVETQVPRGAVATSKLFLHCESGILAYRPITSRLSAMQFRTMLCRLIESAHDRFFLDAGLVSVAHELEIRQALDRLERVNSVAVDLHPSNPNAARLWRHVDERLQKLKAIRQKQQFIGGNEGLDIDALKNDDAFAEVLMAADGYGDATVTGIQDGEKVTIRTTDSPVTKEVIDSDLPSPVLEQLIGAFRRIWERMER